jgi:SAM-dependent methyltransferase
VPIFTAAASPFAQTADASLEALQPLAASMVVLDVACGVAHVSDVVAPHVRQVVGVDLTPELLAAGADRLRERAITNVLLAEGDATALPFVDASFDLVFCRSSVHHFVEPRRHLAEMARVGKPGGRVVVFDMVAPDLAVRDTFDALHRALDPSHVHALLDVELAALLEEVVGPVTACTTSWRPPLRIEAMVNPSSDAKPVVEALARELAGGPPTGFTPSLDDTGALQVSFRSTAVEVRRPR